MKKAIIKKVTASVLVGALAATSFGAGNIAMAARNNTDSSDKNNVSYATGSAIGWNGDVPTDCVVNWKPEKDVVTGSAINDIFPWQDVIVITGTAIDWSDFFNQWAGNTSTNDENKGNYTWKDVVSGGAVTTKPEKDENKGNHSDKEVVSGGAVTAKPEKDENKENHSDKEVVSGGAVTAKPEKDENKENHSDKEVVSGGAVTTKPENNASNKTDKTTTKKNKKVKVKKAKKTAKNKIKVTLDGTNVWSNVKVSVKTSAGKKVKASIVKKTKNYCVIKTSKKLAKKTYVITIKGVKVKGTSTYETITTKVKVK